MCWNWLFWRKKKEEKRKKKILLWTLIPISLVVIALSILLGCLFGCNKGSDEHPIPITNKFYKFNSANEVMGWSDDVLKDSSLLKPYDMMKLNKQTIASDCEFGTYNDSDLSVKNETVWESWECKKIDLSNTIWKFGYHLTIVSRTVSYTGYRTFSGHVTDGGREEYLLNLSHVTSINLSGAIFDDQNMTTTDESVTTGLQTFWKCDLSNLTSLNLDETKFVLTNNTRSANVFTAYGTFRSNKFSNLLSLDLSKAIFCCNHMTSGEVSTGFVTFYDTSFDKLKLLSINGTFATKEMTTGNVITACQTFQYAKFPEVTTISLIEGVYAAESMTTTGNNIDVASYTFADTEFGKLSKLDLSTLTYGNHNDGKNGIGGQCFLDFDNRWWSDANKLQIVDNQSFSWTNAELALNDWFGANHWTLI